MNSSHFSHPRATGLGSPGSLDSPYLAPKKSAFRNHHSEHHSAVPICWSHVSPATELEPRVLPRLVRRASQSHAENLKHALKPWCYKEGTP